MISFDIVYVSLPMLLRGAQISLLITFFSSVLGFVLGALIGGIQLSKSPIFRFFSSGYVALIRGTPMLVQITFWYYLLPQFGITISALATAIIAIGCNSGAYVSEAFRAGILSVPRGQIEAARVLGFSNWQVRYYIVFPQAFRVMLPALGNEVVTLIKDSSLASIIGVAELYKEARNILNQTYDVITVFMVIAIFYLVLTFCASTVVHYIERRLNWYVRN